MIRLILLKGEKAYDVSELVSSVSWKGRRGSAARSLSVNFIDDDGYKHDRTGINVGNGDRCIFYWNGKELFRGIIMLQEQSNSKSMSVTAYDNCIYLSNNSDTFTYSNRTASSIFIDVCSRFGLRIGEVTPTNYQISDLVKSKTTGWDAILDALSITFEATGRRYYPVCLGEKINLIERRNNILQWVIETGTNIETYSYSKSIENIKSRIKVFSKEDQVVAQAQNNSLESKIGIFQDVISAEDDMNSAQLNELAQSTLKEKSTPVESLNVSCLGVADIITGTGVFVKIAPLNIAKTYYVESDTHDFTGNKHVMSLSLSLANDIYDSN